MPEAFNPYQQWLGLSPRAKPYNYYELFDLPPFEASDEKIAQAADRALAKVRGFRPGDQGKAWAALLDELSQARRCLIDPERKAEYDTRLRTAAEKGDGPRRPIRVSQPSQPAAPAAEATSRPADRRERTPTEQLKYPPGMGPKGRKSDSDEAKTARPRNTPAKASAAPQSVPAPQAPAGQAPAPAAPTSPQPAAYPSPMSPAQTPYMPAPQGGTYPQAPAAPSYPAGGYGGWQGAPNPMAPQGMAPNPMAPAAPTPQGWGGNPLPMALPYPAQGTGYAPMPQQAYGMPGAQPYGAPGMPPYGQAGGPSPYGPAYDTAYASPMAPHGHGAPQQAGPAAYDPMAPLGLSAAPAYGPPMGTAAVAAPGAVPYGHTTPSGFPANGPPNMAAPMGAPTGAPFSQAAPEPSVPVVKARSSSSVALEARKRDRQSQTMLIAGGVVVALLLLVAALAYPLISASLTEETVADNTQVSTTQPSTNVPAIPTPPTGQAPAPAPSLQPAPAPSPAPMPAPMTPSPMPTPMSAPAAPMSPMPTPMPPKPEPASPTSTPAPAPMTTANSTPETPPPAPPASAKPTRDELMKLSKVLTLARDAFSEHNFELGQKQIAEAEKLAKTPEHQALVERLRRVGEMAKQFREAVSAAIQGLEAGEVFKVGTSTQVAVVETFPDKIIVRIAGQNRTYNINEMPQGLAVALADMSLDASDPRNRVVKGAYVALGKNSDSDAIAKAKTWWEEAQLGGVDVSDLMPFFTDKYDFQKELAELDAPK